MLIGSGFAPDAALGLSARAARYLPEITRRLTDAFGPSRIILFGSQATGRARDDSDVDLLVVVDHVEDKRQLRVAMRQAVVDIPIDKDILVIAEHEAVARHGRSILATALREGVPVDGH
ncbi:MAG: nucleotidyltransferase domain-containing protein [Candidatus Limnocylindrales bacterium]